MDEELTKLLESWKVKQIYIDRLADQEIFSVEMLLLLTDENIKQVFNTIGSYMGFSKHFEKFKAEWFVPMTVEDLDLMALIILVEELVEKVSTLSSEVLTPSSGPIDSGNEESLDESRCASPKSPESAIAMDSEAVDSTHNGAPNALLTVEVQPRKRKFSFDNDMDLLKVLESTVNGKVILSQYRENNCLSATMRNTLADVIVNEHLKDDYDRKLSYDCEVSIAEKICKLFPTESKEMWVSSTPGARQTSCGRAKLISRYYQKRRFLRKGKLIKDNEKDKDTSYVSSDEDDPNEEQNDDVLWLKNNKQPWSKVENLWKSTAAYRLRKLKAGSMSTETYMNAYPALRDPAGYLLLEMDFDLEFPNSKKNILLFCNFDSYISENR